MEALYQFRGCTLLIRLLAIQALMFATFAMTPFWMPILASSGQPLGTMLPAWVLLALACLFMERVWTALSEAIFCLGGAHWRGFLDFAIRPLLWSAPVAAVASGLLEAQNPAAGWSAIPVLVIGTSGLLVCAYLLLLTWPLLSSMRRARRSLPAQLDSLAEQHGAPAVQRLSDALHYALGLSDKNPFQMRRGLNVPDLPSSPWHDRSRFLWAAEFERRFGMIQAEALRVINSKEVQDYYYPGAVSGSWKTFWLVADGKVIEPNAARCPETMRALATVPDFPYMREAHFSILQAGGKIKPHCDDTNMWLTGHFGIKIPNGCGIRVGRETKGWHEGGFVFFDTSYQHECWNESEQPRVVLLFDFLHPDLSEAERNFFRAPSLDEGRRSGHTS